MPRNAFLSLALVAQCALPSGCREERSRPGSPAAREKKGQPPRRALPVADYLEDVPDRSALVLLADLTALKQAWDDGIATLVGHEDAKAAWREADAVCRDRLGVACSTAKLFGLWARWDPGPHFVATIDGLIGRFRKPTSKDPGTSKIVTLSRGGRLYLAESAALLPPPGKKFQGWRSRLRKFPKAVLDRLQRSAVLVLLDTSRIQDPSGETPKGIAALGLTGEGNLVLALAASEDQLVKAETLLRLGAQLGLAQLESRASAMAETMPALPAAAIRYGLRIVKGVKERVDVERTNGVLLLSTSFPGSRYALAILAPGLLSALGAGLWKGRVQRPLGSFAPPRKMNLKVSTPARRSGGAQPDPARPRKP